MPERETQSGAMPHGFSCTTLFASAVLLSSSVTLSVHLQPQADKAVMYKGAVNRVWDELSEAEKACFYKEEAWLPHMDGPNGRPKQKADSPGHCQAQCANFTSCDWFDYRPCTGNCFFGAWYTPALGKGYQKHKHSAISGERTCPPTPSPTPVPSR